MNPLQTDVLVIGAGPTGASAAAWCARAGLDVLVVDAHEFPRDKPCGDGLTPRAIAEMQLLGMAGWLRHRPKNWGLRAHGFGQTWHLRWPGGSMPSLGSAAPRTELDRAFLAVAEASGARFVGGLKIVEAKPEASGRLRRVVAADGTTIACRRVVVADGARSVVGRALGRQYHRDTVYGVAVRAYAASERSNDPWITSHLDVRGDDGGIVSGYGWIFPLGNGTVNVGVGSLATARRPADLNLRRMVIEYHRQHALEWRMAPELQAVRSAFLPMGGAVSGVAGRNWVLAGDAAGCVNPLNGEGIDYGLETGRMAAELFAAGGGLVDDVSGAWPNLLSQRYGRAFSSARRVAEVLTQPEFFARVGPIGMRSRRLMSAVLRVMGNLMTEEDTDLVARLWRLAGAVSMRYDARPPFAA